MSYQSGQPRVNAEGHLVREITVASRFSSRRFLLVAILASVLIVTNPANELRHKMEDAVDKVLNRKNTTRQRDHSEWTWNKMLDPPVSVTNFGLFSVEERTTKIEFLGLTQKWSCPYYNGQMGSFCSALARNLCHKRPLLHDPKEYAYTAHRVICYLLIFSSMLAFCYGGYYPASLATDPLLGAILKTFGRAHFSIVSLGLDLLNAGMHVYPALVRMEKTVPTLMDGGIASSWGLPAYADFIFYVIVLILFLGGGSNTLASQFGKHDCLGFDSTVAAAAGYSSAFSGALSTQHSFMAPQTVLWVYLPLTAVLGGSSVAWILGGVSGVMLGQYHLDNQDLVLAIKQTIRSVFF